MLYRFQDIADIGRKLQIFIKPSLFHVSRDDLRDFKRFKINNFNLKI